MEGRVGQKVGFRLGKFHEGDNNLSCSYDVGHLDVCGQFSSGVLLVPIVTPARNR